MIEWMLKLVTGNLTPAEGRVLMAVGWRAVVSFHMLYACGYLATVGLPLTGFAQQRDLDEIKNITNLQLRLGLTREIRLQTNILCTSADAVAREGAQNMVDKLREDYRLLTGQNYPEQRCP
jgi:hypothetical protein